MTRQWLLIHTKIGQEQMVLEHLQRQGCECFLPMAQASAAAEGVWSAQCEPLFPRFVFLRSNAQPVGDATQEPALDLGMGPSLSFRQTFIRVDDELMAVLRALTAGGVTALLSADDSVLPDASGEPLTQMNATVFTTVAAICRMANGEKRVLELLNTLSKRLKPQPDSSQTSTPGQWAAPLASPFKASLAGASPL